LRNDAIVTVLAWLSGHYTMAVMANYFDVQCATVSRLINAARDVRPGLRMLLWAI
jgi:hypothetical protein